MVLTNSYSNVYCINLCDIETDTKGQMLMRKIGKIILFAALVGAFYGIWFLGKKGDISFSEIIITYAFARYQFSYTDIVYITTRMLPYFLFKLYISITRLWRTTNCSAVFGYNSKAPFSTNPSSDNIAR